MAYLILVAIINGIFIALARTINGQLSQSVGALSASFWNHLVGFLFLSSLVITLNASQLIQSNFLAIPIFAWLGGFWGALFVLISSYVFPRLGAMKASMLIIAGQIISAVILDTFTHGSMSLVRICGMMLIAMGIILTMRKN